MNASAGPLRRIVGFGSIPLISSLAPFLLLPIVARIGGPAGWVAVLSAQAIGSMVGVLVMFGWGVDGQARVALAASEAERNLLYRRSWWSRTRLLLVLVPIGAVAIGVTSHPGTRLIAVLMFVAVSVTGLSMAWFATGTGDAASIVRYEVGPRTGSLVLAAVAMLVTRDLWVYPVFLIVATALGLAGFHRRLLGSVWPARVLGSAPDDRGRGLRPAFTAIFGALYSAAPVPVATHLETAAAAAQLASTDKLFRYGTMVVTALGNALQSWALEVGSGARASRIRRVFLGHVAFGLVGGACLALGGPLATRILFGADVEAGRSSSVLYAVAFLALNVSTPLVRNVLVPFGGMTYVLGGTLATLLVGLPAMILLGTSMGPVGVAAGLAISESMSAVVSAAGTAVVLRKRAETAPGRTHDRENGGRMAEHVGGNVG